ncbi:MAG: four helix bundle protein [Bacteroidales bacterium]|nr:four helix bundle protein [Bacteroidales bacterium]HQG78527.1 four helix bundle protein [Bacteroidales bacterium]
MESPLKNKSYVFAIRIVKLMQYLQNDKKEFVLSKQILRSGTAVGALIHEAEFAQSKPDFTHKMNIALKEANETEYWLNILKDTDYLEQTLFESLCSDCKELIAMLVSSVKTSKGIK